MISMPYPHIAERVFNTPLLVMPQKLDAMLFGLSSRFGMAADRVVPNIVANASTVGVSAEEYAKNIGAYTTYVGERKSPGYRVIDDVGVIDVFGALAHLGGFQADSTYILGYQQISRMLTTARNDREVEKIVMNFDTPGGDVGGVFDLAEEIRDTSLTKPVYGVAGNLAASAGYLLGSACSELSITQTGWVGSIGVVMRHADFSRMLDAEGIKVTHIFAGAHKVDGNPYEALPDDVREQFQVEIDELYAMFVNAVSNNTGLSEDAIRDTQAQVYMGQAAVERGLATRVETPDQLISRLSGSAGQAVSTRALARQSVEEKAMSDEDKQTETADTPTVTQTDHEAAVAKAREQGIAAGAEQECKRISAILNNEAAAGREEMAKTLATETRLSADEAVTVLAKSPVAAKTETKAGSPSFEKIMSSLNPDVTADAGNGGDETDEQLIAAVVGL